MLCPAANYEDLRDGFGWDIPDRLNMATQVCDDWADRAPDRIALFVDRGPRITYGALRQMADCIAHSLEERGVGPGDRVGVLRDQGPWCAAAHIGIWKCGAISVPLFKLFKRDALKARCDDAGVKLAVTDSEGMGMLADLGVPTLEPRELVRPQRYETRDMGSEDPAVLIYTSGTTGKPKGALHAHRVLTGHLPGVEMSHDFLGQPDDCLWTPADWAWIGGLFDVLMPGLALGVPVLATRLSKFQPDQVAELIARNKVRNVFLPPTALRMLKASGEEIEGLRSVASGGEPLGAEMLKWGQSALGVTINEFYGQTECNMTVSSCAALGDAAPGCAGWPVPGHRVQVIDDDGFPTDDEGEIAVQRGSASMMLRYWNNPRATQEKYRGDWMLTGDRGMREGDRIRIKGREDDVITSAGYRIGPGEIEDCLLTHPDVQTAGVVGKPDALRTEIVKAYVVLKEGKTTTASALQAYVKSHLAAYSYPREVEFLDALPMTVTGKVIRKELKARAMAEVAP